MREELHFRRIDMRAFRRDDGLFEVEGRVVDRKPYDFGPVVGSHKVLANQPIHDMGVRLVFDERLVVQDVSTFTNASPYGSCPEGGRALQSLKGLQMTSGWGKEVRSRLGGSSSCTHLRELLVPMATVAYQSLAVVHLDKPEQLDANGRPVKIDSCYAYGATQELVRVRWPQHYRPPTARE